MSSFTLQSSVSPLTFVGSSTQYKAAQLGADPSGTEPDGDSWVYQTISVPVGTTTLTFKYWPYSDDSISFDWQECQIQNNAGGFLAQVFKVCTNTQAWTDVAYDLSAYAGQTIRLWFNAHGDNAGDFTYMFLGRVSAKNGSTELMTNGDFASNFTGWTVGTTGGSPFVPVITNTPPTGLNYPPAQALTISMSDSSVLIYNMTIGEDNPSVLNLTSVDTVIVNQTTYHGTITGGAANAFLNAKFRVAGFTNNNNNGTYVCTASTATTLVLQNPNGFAETHAATALQMWLSVSPTFQPTTPTTETCSVTPVDLASGTYTGNLNAIPYDFKVVSQGTIAWPIPLSDYSPGAGIFNPTPLAWSPTGSTAYGILCVGDAGTPLYTVRNYLFKLDRSTNSVVWTVLMNSHLVTTTPAPHVCQVIVGDSGTYVYAVYLDPVALVGTVEKRLASDGSLNATLTNVSNGTAGANGTFSDIDIATISGTEYLALVSWDNSNPLNAILSVIRTSDMTLTFKKTVSMGGTGTPNLPCAFDNVGNVWWMPIPANYGPPGSGDLNKVAVPSGGVTVYPSAGSTDAYLQMTFDASDNTLILTNGSEHCAKYSMTGALLSELATGSLYSAGGGSYIDAVGTWVYSPRLRDGGQWLRTYGLGAVKHTDDVAYRSQPIDVAGNQSPNFVNSPGWMDNTSHNSHNSSTVDLTIWTYLTNNNTGAWQWAWFDVAIVGSVTVPVTFTIPGECGRVTITGIFQDAKGTPLAGGKVRVYPFTDCKTCDNKQLAAGIFYDVALDGSGSIPNGNLLLYPTTQLTADGPNVGTYRIQVFSSKGVLAWQKNKISIPTTNPFDLSTL